MTAMTRSSVRLDAGRVIRSTVQALGRDWPTFLALGLVCSLAPRLLARWILYQPQVIGLGGGSVIGAAALAGGLTLAVQLLPTALLVGVIALRATACLGAEHRPLGDCLVQAVRRTPILAAASLVMNLGIILGLALLVVPGALIALAWCVALPAAALERTALTAAFRRSAELTKGHRGTILLLGLACAVAVIALALAVGVGLGAVARPLRTLTPGALGPDDPAAVIGGALGAMIAAVLTAAGGAALYHELRQLKDGGGAQTLAAVFD